MPNVRQIRKELAILIKEKHKTLTTQKEKDNAVNIARQEINLKYGKNWREDERYGYPNNMGYGNNSRNPQHIGTDIPEGDEWFDYAQTADDF